MASRRGAEELIRSGRISIDGIPIRTVNHVVPMGSVVTLDGKSIEPEQRRLLIALNKPPGVVTTVKDPHGRPTVLDSLPDKYRDRRLVPVGRLDQDSCGLLLLSNDGDLIHALLHPSRKVWKRYRVEVSGKITSAVLDRLRASVELDGRPTAPAEVDLVKRLGPSQGVLEVAIREGRRRQIRRVCSKIGLRVTHLRRIGFGPIKLGNLPEGQCRALSTIEVASLLEAGGL
ncbi:MAG: pseudouridine synthase [bacterium]